LKEEAKLQMVENNVLTKMLKPYNDKLNEQFRILCTQELWLYVSVVRIVKSRSLPGAEHVTRMKSQGIIIEF
jgi:hypothetical protein